MAPSNYMKATDFDFSWEIHDFSNCCCGTGQSIYSKVFTGHWTKWQLSMIPMKSENNEKFISIFIQLLSRGQTKVIASIQLMNSLDQIFSELIASKLTFSGIDVYWEWPRFVNRELVMNNPLVPLVDDVLIVRCKLSLDAFTSEPVIRDELTRNMECLFLSQQFSDVSIIIGGQKLAAHKNILAARSKVFSAMFNCDMVENKENNLNITDISYDVMKELLRFIYCGKVEKLKSMVISLLKAADKYDIGDLKALCEQMIWRTINVSKACNILQMADTYNCKTLKTEAIQYVMKNLSTVIETDDFKKLKITNPKLLEEIIITNGKKR